MEALEHVATAINAFELSVKTRSWSRQCSDSRTVEPSRKELLQDLKDAREEASREMTADGSDQNSEEATMELWQRANYKVATRYGLKYSSEDHR